MGKRNESENKILVKTSIENMHTKLKEIVNNSLEKFNSISLEKWTSKPSSDKWSKKEILGHLCDSAYNNMRRFIVTQYQQNDKIYYRQDDWVRIQDYQNVDIHEIITLWKLINYQIARIIEAIPDNLLQNTCDTNPNEQQLVTLEFLMKIICRIMID